MSRPRAGLGQWCGQRDTRLLRQHRKSRSGERHELADEPTDPARMFRRQLRRVLLRLRLERGATGFRERRQRRESRRSVVTNGLGHCGAVVARRGDRKQVGDPRVRTKLRDGHLRRIVDRRHDRLLPEHRHRVSRGLLDFSAVECHHRSHRVNVPFGAGVDPGLRLAGDGGGGLWFGVIHRRAGGAGSVRGARGRPGTTSDPNDDAGTFSLTLEVGVLIQSVPTTAAVKVSGSQSYHDQLNVTGSDGAVTYVQTSGTPALIVGASGLVSTSGALTVGSYVAKGTTSDPVGDEGTFTLTVKVGALVQRDPLK